MPGTKQLVVTGPQGRLLIGWNMAIDSHFSGVLVDMETELATLVGRPIAYSIVDSEASGLTLAERYAEAKRDYLSVLPRNPSHQLTEFTLQGQWQAVADDPDHEVVEATWVDEDKAAQEVRRLILLRPVGATDPTRIYAGRLPNSLEVTHIPPLFRQRWYHQEWRFREMIKGANLNVNYGYSYDTVVNRTRQRQWEKAQEKVEVTQGQLAPRIETLTNLRPQLIQLRQDYRQKQTELSQKLDLGQQLLAHRQQAGQPTLRCQQTIGRCQRQQQALTDRYQKRRRSLLARLRQQRHQLGQLQAQLVEREADREAVDTDTLCRERHLEKDQMMLNLQLLLTNWHDWAADHYFAPEWHKLELETATRLIYQKPGRVRWAADQIVVELEPYRYPDQQRAMEATCARFNAANLCWRDGRPLRIYVAKGS